jgi:uncharacterized protein YutE (UPF0331/DUF86 family)
LVDPESIESRLEHLADLLDELERIRIDGHDAYAEEFRRRLAARHAIQLAVQICVDIGAHMIAELGVRMPDDYKGIFEALRDPVGLDPVLAKRLSDAAGMRNVLVHVYLEVDDDKVWEALDHLDALRQFAAIAQEFAEQGD